MSTSQISIQKVGQRWIARCNYEQRAIPKSAGFRWDGVSRCWYTTDEAVAGKLADPDAAGKLAEQARLKAEAQRASIEASRAATSDAVLACPEGLSYLPYQRAGIAYGLARTAVLIADEMGLGKTIQAIGIINTDESLKRILVICPATLRLNWYKELTKWLTRPLKIVIADGKICPIPGDGFGFDITIINYDILAKHQDRLRSIEWDLIIGDEVHYLKNPEAKRTIAVVGQQATRKKEAIEPIKARRRVFLTGTPIPNRPVEGWPIFSYLSPETFPKFFSYALRYCDAHQESHGWDFSGASNLGELQDKLRGSFMIRRLKADVLTELPAKRRAVIELPANNGAALAIKAEKTAMERNEEQLEALRVAVELAKASDDPEEYKDAVANLRDASNLAFTEISKLRHDTAVAKIPYVMEHLRNAIENGGKVIVFAHHTDVILALKKEFGDQAVSIYGATPMTERDRAVTSFQTDPSVQVFIGQIQAAGVGLTLTAAAHVVFAELDWVPGNMTQCEDRAHRIGQVNSVLVEHLVFEGSLDVVMAKRIIAKQEVLEAALDREPEPMPIVPAKEHAATEDTPRAEIEKIAQTLTPETVEAIHRGLRILAGFDADHAREINNMGYSKLDVNIGHSLAQCSRLSPKQAALGQRLVRKYRRQLPPEILQSAQVTIA